MILSLVSSPFDPSRPDSAGSATSGRAARGTVRALVAGLLVATLAGCDGFGSPRAAAVPLEGHDAAGPGAARDGDTSGPADGVGPAPTTERSEGGAEAPQGPGGAAVRGGGGAGFTTGEAIPASGERPQFRRPEQVRGLYLNAWAAGSRNRVAALVDLARRTEVNAFVIDIKDASGYVSHRTGVPLAHEVGATGELRIRDLSALLRTLEAEGIYPIARIVITRDPLLTEVRPDLAIQDSAGGAWADHDGVRWLNLHDSTVWGYHVDLAAEVVALGFPEVQWDYVRFPDAPATHLRRAVFPGSGGRSKPETVRAFLLHARERLDSLGAASTADVFGVTTTAARDVGIGQVWESFIDAVDVALPMVYPSHYWEGSYGFRTPNAHPYEVVRRALEDALRRSEEVPGAGSTIPWLQDFTLGQPRYGAPEVRAQIQATYDLGIGEWILWNPGSRYTEGALEPEGGFSADPLIRIAGGIHAVSRRHEVLDSVRMASAARTRARSSSPSASSPSTGSPSTSSPSTGSPSSSPAPSPTPSGGAPLPPPADAPQQ